MLFISVFPTIRHSAVFWCSVSLVRKAVVADRHNPIAVITVTYVIRGVLYISSKALYK